MGSLIYSSALRKNDTFILRSRYYLDKVFGYSLCWCSYSCHKCSDRLVLLSIFTVPYNGGGIGSDGSLRNSDAKYVGIGNFRIFQFASAIRRQKTTEDSVETFVHDVGNGSSIPRHFATGYDFFNSYDCLFYLNCIVYL